MHRIKGRIRLAALVTGALLGPACGSGDGAPASPSGPGSFNESCSTRPACPIFVSSENVVGSSRFLVGLIDDNDAPIASPKIEMHLALFDLARSASEPLVETDARFIWTIRGVVGLYVAEVDFARAGTWGAEVSITGAGLDETIRQTFEVTEDSTTPGLGERVPASDTPTGQTPVDLEKISTDTHPDPRFYEVSVAGALKRKEPFVLVFATPKFCESATCGPTLDAVKGVAERHRDVTFIHAEPYEGLEPEYNPPNTTDAVEEWGLPSEPWVFVVDGSGRLHAKFEGALAPAELEAAIRTL